MSNQTANTQTTNFVPVQGTFEPLYPYNIISFIGPAGLPFYAPTNPVLDGVTITNSTINSTTIGLTTPAAAAFTSASATTQPIGNNDLTTKLYVDSLALGISWKQPVIAATTGNITLSGTQTIDTVSVLAGERVLVKNQTNDYENGIYIAAAGPWSRSPDANSWDELISALVFVTEGGLAGSAWYCTAQPGGTLGVTAVLWNNFSVGGVYFAGTGLTLTTGDTFNIANTTVTPASYGSGSQVATFTVNQQGQLTAAANANIAIAATQITSGTIDSARISGSYTGITEVGTLTGLTVTATITGSISGNAATATNATNATTSTNLASGATGSVPYQSGAGATTFVGIGTTGQVLTVAGGVPTWATPTTYGDVTGPASSTDNAIARFDSTTGKIIQNSTITLSDPGALQNVNEINFDTTPASVVGGAGSLAWNSSEGTLDLVMRGGNVTQHIGEEFFYTARNATVSTINKGTPVYASGVTAGSNRIEITPMIANGSIDELRYIGITGENISTGTNGLVTEVGYIRNIDTTGTPYGQTWAAGDIIYVSSTTAGYLSNVQPTAPNLKIVAAIVINVDNNFGVLLARPTPYPQINDLSNVNISTVTGGDLLVYDGTDARWENAAQSTITAGKATNLAGGATGSLPYQSAADTTTFLAAGTDGQVLKLASGVPTWSSDTSGVTISDDTTTNATRYITFSNLTTGNETTLDVSSTKLQFNPSTGALTATSLTPTNALGTAYGGTGLTSLGSGVATWLGTPSSANLAAAVTDETGSGSLVFATSPSLTTPNIGAATATSVNGLTITSSTGTLTVTNGKTLSASNTLTLAGTDSTTMTFPPTSSSIGYLNIPQSGSDKTTSYTLALGDIGEFVGVGSGGSITIPNSTFAAGDAVSIFNNTTGNITITCTITTAYIAGTDTDKATVTLATRGVCTVLFISGTVCVLTGNVS